MKKKSYPIGTVISDKETPTFETVRIKLKAGKDVKPGTLVKMDVSREGEKTILIGRIRSGYESNPNKSVSNVNVNESIGVVSASISEEHSPDIYRLVEADLIEEIIGDKIRFPQNLPNSGAEVSIADSSEVVRVLGLETDKKEGLHLGETVGGIKTDIVLKKSSIQRHFFIGGTTGSGKSYAMGVVAEELIKHNLPVIFIDTQDEYSAFVLKNKGKVVEPGKDFNIRISSLTESEFISILPKSMQDSSLQLDVATYTFGDLKNQILRGERQKFRIDDMLLQTDAAAQLLATKSVPATSTTVRRKLETLRSNQIFGEGCGAADWRKFMYPCMAINCKNLMSRDLQIIATAVLRELQDLRLRNHIPPYVAVVDEAHLFVPQGEGSPCKQIIREGVRIGRHHGICMVLMTQSPVDIDKSVIRQCNTRLVFALEPDQLDAIKGVKADATDEMLRALPKMPQGTCLISGTYESLKHTIPVKIRQRTTKDSEGGKTPDIFQEMQDTWMTKITHLKEKDR